MKRFGTARWFGKKTRMRFRKSEYVVLAFLILTAEISNAKIATRMRRTRSVAVAASAALSWSPTFSSVDFLSVNPQSFTLSNIGTAPANSLSFSVPKADPTVYNSTFGRFIVSSTGTTCGTTLAAGASCTVELMFFNCNTTCTGALPVVCSASVTATSGTVNGVLGSLSYNCGGGA